MNRDYLLRALRFGFSEIHIDNSLTPVVFTSPAKTFKSMNFVNDEEMNQRLETVRKEMLTKTAEEYRNSSEARNQLVAGLSQLRDTAKRLATQEVSELVQRFGEMGRRKLHLAA